MAKLNITIEENESEITTVIVTMTNDVAERITAVLKELFEVPMMGAVMETSDTETVIAFLTMNTERVKIMREAAIKVYFQSTFGESRN